MEIKKFRLRNVGRFDDLEVILAPTERHSSNVTVLVGNNGAGKTTLLRSVAISLSWLVARIRSEKGSGTPIDYDSVQNGAGAASISISVEDTVEMLDGSTLTAQSSLYEWRLSRALKGRILRVPSLLIDLGRLADDYRQRLTEYNQSSLPLIAYYPVERSVLDISLKAKPGGNFEQLDGYDNSLSRGVDFRRFFEWFREREDMENEEGPSPAFLKKIQAIFGSDTELWQVASKAIDSSRDPHLKAVRSAVEAFMPGFRNLRVQRKPRLIMMIDKDDVTLNVAQLSQGEKSMMALVGDIARRLAMLNPALENPLLGDGIVLIDEVDLHLHPKWQRTLIRQLTTTFPHCQFFLTTHSPLVISDAKGVLCYVMDDGDLREQSELYGLDANQVLLGVMDTDVRNSDVQQHLDDLLDLLHGGKLEDARTLYQRLSAELPEGHIELAKAALLIRKLEVRRAKD